MSNQWCRLFALVCFLVIAGMPTIAIAQAPRIGIAAEPSGKLVFTLDGQREFLLFFSYFGAMRMNEGTLRTDFANIKAAGFHGIRFFPNWWRHNVGPDCPDNRGTRDTAPLFKNDGTIDWSMSSEGYVPGTRFASVLNIAYEKGLVVEVALAIEPVRHDGQPFGHMSFDKYKQAILALTVLLRDNAPPGGAAGYRHVFFDLQNEYNVPNGCKGSLTSQQISQLVETVSSTDVGRLVAASVAAEAEPEDAKSLTAGTHIISYHDRRTPDWSEQTGPRIYRIGRSNPIDDPRPIYFSETYPASQAPPSWTKDKWKNAAKLAKQTGASAWCWHTQAFFFWGTNTHTLTQLEIEVASELRSAVNSVTWPYQ